MTRQEAAMEMVKLREMMLFDPILGNEIDYSSLNEENKSLYDAAGVAIEVLRAQEEAEKNEPLTLEELREMDGEPVYVVSYNSDETGWRIVDSVVDYRGAVFDSDRVNVFFNDSFLEDGRTINEEWFAYLRKPKEA